MSNNPAPEQGKANLENTEASADGLALEGDRLTEQQAADLEKQIAASPSDMAARTKLLGYYDQRIFQDRSIREKRELSILWIIANRPGSYIAGTPFADLHPRIDGDAYGEAKKLWIKQVEAHPSSVAVIGNAAEFFTLNGRDLAEGYYKRLQELEPQNHRWSESLAHLYELSAQHPGPGQNAQEQAALALKEMEKAHQSAGAEIDRFYQLDDLAQFALTAGDAARAKGYAQELLSMAPRYQSDWNYGNAIHYAHTVLGRIALQEGQVDQAKEHLLASGRTKGSPQLDSFGPTMDLGRDLIAKDEKQTVIDYLTLCKNFWKANDGALDRWVQEIHDQGTTEFRRF